MANIWRRYPSGRLTSEAFIKQSLYSSADSIATEFWETTSSNVYTLTAQQGLYTVTGISSNISHNRYLSCSPASYTVLGQSADILRHKVLSALAGSYAITGQSVTITYISSGTIYTLSCVSGNYSLIGQNVSILKHRYLSPTNGLYTYSGQGAVISRNRHLTTSSGQYNINGQSISITYTPAGGVYWPTPNQVLLGVSYGPNGNDYVGTLDVYGLKYDINSGKLVKPLTDKVVMTL